MAKFPNIGPKHGFTPLFSADDISESKTRVPKKVIFAYSVTIFNNITKTIKLRPFKSGMGWFGAIKVKIYVNKGRGLLVLKMPPGASITAGMAEVLISVGAKEFLILGSAGALSPKLNPGAIVICNKAIRDEGVSHHYLKPGKYACSDKGLTKQLALHSRRKGILFTEGPTWTMDAIFRETREEVRHYAKQGILTVEMEASALFAVTTKRKAKAAAVFAISDILSGREWSGFHRDRIHGYKKLATIAEIFTTIK